MARNKLRFTVKGMHCQGCAERVQQVLQKRPGVLDARVRFDEWLAEVLTRGTLAPGDLADTIRQAGFEADPLKGR